LSDAVETIVMTESDGKPKFLSIGEHDSELLITTFGGMVIRRCIPSTGCKARNSVMLHSGDYSELYLDGIGVLDETYIVVDRTDQKIWECPLTSVDISKSSCEVFVYDPQGTGWDPANLLVDPIKRLVYVVDDLYSNVWVFSFDRTFFRPLASSRGALMQPSAIAQRPGLYVPLSPSFPPSSLSTAGERIESPLNMVDADNSNVSDSHPTSAHDLALEVTATGVFRGTDIPAIITGEIL
jgi:hypothetical protein